MEGAGGGGNASTTQVYYYSLSSDIANTINLQLNVKCLFLKPALMELPELKDKLNDCCLEVNVLDKCGEAVVSFPSICSKRGIVSENGAVLNFLSERLVFPIRLNQVPEDGLLYFRLIGPPNSRVFAQGCLRIYNEKTLCLRQGKLEIPLYGSGSNSAAHETTTPILVDHIHSILQEEEEERILKANLVASTWLTRLNEIAQINKKKLELKKTNVDYQAILQIELPSFTLPILCNQNEHVPNTPLKKNNSNNSNSNISNSGYMAPPPPTTSSSSFNVFNDFDSNASSSNGAYEEKYSCLNKTTNRALFSNEMEIRPDVNEKKEIFRILSSPSLFSLKQEDNDLLWKFRKFLPRQKNSLSKFIMCVNWQDGKEAQEGKQLLPLWKSNVDVSEVLRLLSSEFNNFPFIQEFSLSLLKQHDDSVLLRYMLQLVQALRRKEEEGLRRNSNSEESNSALTKFLISRAQTNEEVASALHWYLCVETKMAGDSSVFYFAGKALSSSLEKSGMLVAQDEFVNNIMSAVRTSNASRGRWNDRTKRFRELLKDVSEAVLSRAEKYTLPIYPRFRIISLLFEEARILNSNTYPGVVELITVCEGVQQRFTVMFKEGDDLRQDQLILQIIEMINSIFMQVGLDLCLTKYRVLATSTNQGIVEFVKDAMPLSKVVKEHPNISAFFALDADKFGGMELVKTRFIKSCAGYCVITYFLGVGDRHLDNIMVRPNGNLFHVDFGFVFGRDAKSFASPVRITKEMIEAMGGKFSSGFQLFRSYCCEAYKVLRLNSNLLLNIVHLMASAGIPDISMNQSPTQVLNGLNERLQLGLNDASAEAFLLGVIDSSVEALGPIFIDYMHDLAQKMSTAMSYHAYSSFFVINIVSLTRSDENGSASGKMMMIYALLPALPVTKYWYEKAPNFQFFLKVKVYRFVTWLSHWKEEENSVAADDDDVNNDNAAAAEIFHCSADQVRSYMLLDKPAVKVSGGHFSLRVATEISGLLEWNTTLTYVDLSNCGLEEEHVNILAHGLRVSCSLKTLYLSNNNFGDEGSKCLSLLFDASTATSSLSSSSSSSCTLEKLYVNYCNIKNLYFTHLGRLKVLDLGGNRINNTSLSKLSHILKNSNNQVLRELSLYSNESVEGRDDGVFAIIEALYMNDTLETLNVKGCEIANFGTFSSKLCNILQNYNETLNTIGLTLPLAICVFNELKYRKSKLNPVTGFIDNEEMVAFHPIYAACTENKLFRARYYAILVVKTMHEATSAGGGRAGHSESNEKQQQYLIQSNGVEFVFARIIARFLGEKIDEA